MFGFLNINKPAGITSHKVIAVLRKITGIKQIGHAGTLDPLASGVLPAAFGKASRLIDYMTSDKSYRTGLYLGMKSDTYDIEGNLEKTNYKKITEDEITQVLNQYRGNIKQTPPVYSAVHYKGKRLYELAREGKIPDDIPSRDVTVYKNEIISFDYENQILKLDISCSKGTYIRTIVNDIGEELKCGAVMYELIRTKSSSMNIEDALELNDELTKEKIIKNIIPPQSILNMQKIEITENDYKRVINGSKFKNIYNAKNEILLIKNGNIVAVAFADNDFIQPEKVLI
ncbi:MAG: tRNA pseudouridine(55) synthase TruB [Candidatus Gastranaerophilales bacterium]|nr:tRNA pseudouridine(55) synthase TruB [Candidatus Gastranaerophilales bacterium]